MRNGLYKYISYVAYFLKGLVLHLLVSDIVSTSGEVGELGDEDYVGEVGEVVITVVIHLLALEIQTINQYFYA